MPSKSAVPETAIETNNLTTAPKSTSAVETTTAVAVSPVAVATAKTAVDDSALSRALKRKFTELEEITQRLRARLFDVTGNMTIDPDDQFENDLNTIPDEGDDDFEESNMASEMSLDWLEHCHNQAAAAAATTTDPKTVHSGHDHDENLLSTAQMHDIFEYLSTTDSNQSRPSADSTSVEEQHDPQQVSFSQKLSSRFNEVLNEEKRAWSGSTAGDDNKVENSIDNIAESLQKSLINE